MVSLRIKKNNNICRHLRLIVTDREGGTEAETRAREAVEPPENECEANTASGCSEGRLSAHTQQGKLNGDQFNKGKSPRPGAHPTPGLAGYSLQALTLPSPSAVLTSVHSSLPGRRPH